MKNFLKKIYICLFSPKRICFFFGEKIYKSIIQLVLLSLIAITPFILTLSFNDRVSNSSYRHLENSLMENYNDINIKLQSGNLTGETGYAFLIDEAIVFINPNNEKLELNSVEYAPYHIIELKQDRVEVIFMNKVISSFTYSSYGIVDIDFTKINDDADYYEFDKFMAILNHALDSYQVGYIIGSSFTTLLDVFLTILLSSLILAVIVRIFNPLLPFAIRFKGALDSQVISVLCILLMLLFNFEPFRYIGMVLSAIYLIMTVIQAFKIEMAMKSQANSNLENKENKENKE